LTHAKSAQKEKPDMHLDEGIKHLEGAVASGKKGDAPGGTKHAEEALSHLSQAK
jgi:hypothetical protein